ncbi:MAG TPA: carbon-nitrogen hydrolase family protein [Caldilineae bacterium]|nr:carbon-nitrogen hydrolase family protein [Caldilineae bacterium]
MRETTIALVQMAPALGEPEKNLRRMADYIERICLEQPTDLILFPELVITGYELGPRFTEMAERVPGHAVNFLAKPASEFGVHIAFGLVIKERVESIIYNGVVLLGPEGELVGDYRKVHLKGEERMAFRPGYRYPVFDLPFGRVGLLIGWDLAFPEAARSLVLDGAELICVSAAWEAAQADEWRAYCFSRAYENATFIAAVDRVGEEPSYQFLGESMLVGPRGEVYTRLEGNTEGYAVAKIDLDNVRTAREESQIIQCRQPQTYRNLVKKY